jgi:hypothetical protein
MVSLVGLASAGIDRLTGVPSQWGGMSRALMARFFPVESVVNEATGKRTFIEARDLFGFGGSDAFVAPVTDVQFELAGNWQSPFENSGPESKTPSLMAIIQSGQLGTSIAALQGVAGAIGLNADGAKEVLKKSQDVARKLEGKTGMTKLNSTQVFSGSPPVKIMLTLHLRALQNPTNEVEKPYNALLGWAAPKRLADDSYLNNAAAGATDDRDFLDIMFPSEAPSLIGFSYTGKTFLPMVIESISNPMDGQLGISGQSIYKTVQITLATLTALDSEDLKKIFKRQGFF